MNTIKKLLVIYLAFLCNSSYGQTSNTNRDCARYLLPVVGKDSEFVDRDSVLKRYLTYGAWQYPIFSHYWSVYIDSALVIMPQDGYLWHQKATPFFKQMKYEVGMIYLDSAVKYDANSYLDYRAFIKCIYQKNYHNSINDFENAKKLKGNSGVMDHPYDFYIGLCYLQLNKFDTATKYFQKCVNEDLKRGTKWVHPLRDFYLAVCYYELGNYENSEIHLNRAISNYSHFSDAKFYKALCLANCRKFKDAIELINDAEIDLKNGATINEDNSKYEKYPYQIDKSLLEFYKKRLEYYAESIH